MGQPAAVSGDQVNAVCSLHLMPNSATGAPQPSPSLPFAAPITLGVCATVLVCGSPAVVVGASGVNTPPHVGLHPADPFFAPPATYIFHQPIPNQASLIGVHVIAQSFTYSPPLTPLGAIAANGLVMVLGL